MKLFEDSNNCIIGRVTFPLSNYLLNRGNIIAHYKRLIKSEWYPEDLLQQLQFNKLINLIKHSNRCVPYYTKKFKEIGLLPQDIKDIDDIKLLPPLTREDVIEYHKEMVDMRFQSSVRIADNSKREPGEPISFARFRKHKLVRNTSSGSTGTPTVFYENGSITSSNWANELRMRNWYGINPGAKEMRMARISTEYMPKNRTLLMRKYLWNQLVLPGTNLSDADYKICYENIRKFRPKVFWGFTSALSGLAEYIQKNSEKLPGHCPDLVITWAAPLYEHEKKVLMSVFGCPVTNIYGAREVGHIAAICPHGTFHINQESLLVETDDVDGDYGGKESGEILVTTLENTLMPFIRYRMGDVGRIASSDCSCGRSLQVLKDFLGRTGEIFITRDGRMISPNFWCRTFMNDRIAKAFKRFQVIYKRDGNISIKLVRKDNSSHEAESLLKEFLKKNFHSDIKVDFDYVEKIEPQISGKYQMVINEAENNTSLL